MAVIGPDVTAMSAFLNVPATIEPLFASSLAKSYIAVSTALVNIIASTPDTITYLKTIAITSNGGVLPDGNASNFQVFAGAPSVVLVLTARANHIAATTAPYQLRGTPEAGDQSANVLSLSGTVTTPHVAAYTALEWNLQTATATAAGQIELAFVDMS
jgi:hypothetical protein